MKMLHGLIIVFDLMMTAYEVAEVCVPPDAAAAKATASTAADASGDGAEILTMMGLEIP